MYLNGYVLGVSYLSNTQSTPTKRAFSKITIHGNATIDKLHVKEVVLSNEELLQLNFTGTRIWDSDTILLAEFEGALGAGNITNLVNPITQWEINRKEISETAFKKLGVVDGNKSTFTDWTTQANKEYVYNIFALTDTEVGEPLETESIKTDYYGWYLIDKESGISYEFNLNIQSGGIENVTDMAIYDGYTKYPSFSIGQRDYIKGSLSAIAGDILTNGKLYQPTDYLDDLRAFINNGKEKILKSRKGHIWNVMTTNYREAPLSDDVQEQPYTISFDFIESSEVK